MQTIWKQHRWVFVATLFFWIILATWLIIHGKEDAFLLINNARVSLYDSTMPYLTFLGDGLFAVIIGLLLLFKNYRTAFMVLTAFLVSGLLAQLFKGVLFPDMLRPLAYFEELGIEIQTLENVKVRKHRSFPSGHTTTAFALFFSLILLYKQKLTALVFLLLAIIAGYSRIYLGQHFVEDVLVGSVLGIATALASFFVWKGAKWKFLDANVLKRTA